MKHLKKYASHKRKNTRETTVLEKPSKKGNEKKVVPQEIRVAPIAIKSVRSNTREEEKLHATLKCNR